MKFSSIRSDLRVALLYLLFGGLWIALTDRLLAALVPSISVLTTLQTYKGWAFVLASAALIFILLRRDLRNRQLAETKLHEGEVRYRLITENASDLLYRYRIQPVPKFEFISAASLAFTGYSPEEFYADRNLALKIIHPDDLSLIREALAANVPPANPLLVRWIRKDGTLIWVEQRVTYYKDAQDRIEVVDCVGRDITGRKRAEEAVGLAEANYRSIFENAPVGIYQSTPEGRYLSVNPVLARIYGYTSPEEMLAAIENITAQIYVNPADRARFARLMDENGLVSDFIAENNRKDGAPIWIQTSARAVKDASGGILYYEGFITDITERRRMEETVVESEERYRHIFENAMESITQTTPEGRFITANPAAAHMQGYDSPQELIADISSIERQFYVQPGRRQEFIRLMEKEGSVTGFESEVFRKDGTTAWVSENSRAVRDEHGSLLYYEGVSADITERKRAEQALQRSEEKYRQIFENAMEAITQTTPDGKYLTANPAAVQMLGYDSPQELIAAISDIEHQFYVEPGRRREFIGRMEKEGVITGFESEFFRKDGSTAWISENSRAVRDEHGSLLYYEGTAVDVTERKRAEQALLRSEEKYRHIFENAMESITQTTPDGKFITANPAAAQTLGYDSPQEMIAGVSDIERQFYVQPGRRQEFISLMEKEGSVTGFESEVFRRDGSIAWVSENSRAVRDEHGCLLYYEGTTVDITDSRRAQEQLRASEEKYRSLFANIPFSIAHCRMIFDGDVPVDYEYIAVNPAFEETTGLKDVAGKKVSDVIPGYPRNNPESLAVFGRVARTGESTRWEHYLADLDVWFSFTVFRRAPDEIVIVTEDISSRKHAEAKVNLQVERLAALNAIDHAISSSFDLNLSLSVLLLHAVKELKVDAADVLLFNPNLNVLEYFIGRGFHMKNVEATRLHLGDELADHLIMERQSLIIPNIAANELTASRAKSLEAESFIRYCAVPLINKGKIKGVLEVFHRAPLEPDKEWLGFLNTLSEQAALAIDNHELFDGMQRSNDELRLAYDTTIEGWSHALDLRDKETEGHTQRVKEMTLKLAQAAGMREEEMIHVRRGVLLHDIGKLGVPDDILLKPGALTDEEWTIMRQHPVYAYELISPIEFLRQALDIPYCHHEKWDGTGYPRGLKGEQIPLAARLFTVVDVWDALSSDRPYRRRWSKEKVMDYIRSLSGTYFDPHAVELFFEVFD